MMSLSGLQAGLLNATPIVPPLALSKKQQAISPRPLIRIVGFPECSLSPSQRSALQGAFVLLLPHVESTGLWRAVGTRLVEAHSTDRTPYRLGLPQLSTAEDVGRRLSTPVLHEDGTDVDEERCSSTAQRKRDVQLRVAGQQQPAELGGRAARRAACRASL